MQNSRQPQRHRPAQPQCSKRWFVGTVQELGLGGWEKGAEGLFSGNLKLQITPYYKDVRGMDLAFEGIWRRSRGMGSWAPLRESLIRTKDASALTPCFV